MNHEPLTFDEELATAAAGKCMPHIRITFLSGARWQFKLLVDIITALKKENDILRVENDKFRTQLEITGGSAWIKREACKHKDINRLLRKDWCRDCHSWIWKGGRQ